MAMRDAWIEKRTAAMNGGTRNFSQMHYARKGVITEEMHGHDRHADRKRTHLVGDRDDGG